MVYNFVIDGVQVKVKFSDAVNALGIEDILVKIAARQSGLNR